MIWLVHIPVHIMAPMVATNLSRILVEYFPSIIVIQLVVAEIIPIIRMQLTSTVKMVMKKSSLGTLAYIVYQCLSRTRDNAIALTAETSSLKWRLQDLQAHSFPTQTASGPSILSRFASLRCLSLRHSPWMLRSRAIHELLKDRNHVCESR